MRAYRADDAIAHTPQARKRFIGSYRYFGVESTAAVPLAFSRPMLEKGNRVCITITNGNASSASTTPAVVATVPAASPPPAPATGQVASADFAGTVVDVGFTAIFDDIEFRDYTQTGPHSLRVYVYDDRTSQWIYCSPIFLRGYGDKDGINLRPYVLCKFIPLLRYRGGRGCIIALQHRAHKKARQGACGHDGLVGRRV